LAGNLVFTIFVFTKNKNMTPTTIIPAVNVNTNSAYSSDVFYGSFDTMVKGKRNTVHVCNHLKDTEKEYEFRIAGKCQAGFINIHDTKGTPHSVIAGYKKNSLVNIQVKNESGYWLNVFTTKSGKWYGIDLGFLKVLTVGDMRQSFPDMCDMNLWEMVGAKTWADKAFSK
jgi:hypothetical protein